MFRGEVLSVQQMLQRVLPETEIAPTSTLGVLHTAASNAMEYNAWRKASPEAEDGWRFAILQTLDDYTSTLRRGGARLGQPGGFSTQRHPDHR